MDKAKEHTEEFITSVKAYLEKNMWTVDSGPMGSGYSICRNCYSLQGKEHKSDCTAANLLSLAKLLLAKEDDHVFDELRTKTWLRATEIGEVLKWCEDHGITVFQITNEHGVKFNCTRGQAGEFAHELPKYINASVGVP